MFSGGDRLEVIKQMEAKDTPDLADVRTAGVGATAPGGHPSQMGGPPFPTISAPEQAQSFVDARIGEGSDYIKIIHDDGSNWKWTTKREPMLDNATMKALVEAAHKRGKLVVVHALLEQQARDAIAAGADGLAYMFSGESIGPDFGELVASHHMFVIPTLATVYWDCGESQGSAVLADAVHRRGVARWNEVAPAGSDQEQLLQRYRRGHPAVDGSPRADSDRNRRPGSGHDLWRFGTLKWRCWCVMVSRLFRRWQPPLPCPPTVFAWMTVDGFGQGYGPTCY